jgi:adenylate cyclase
MWGAPEPQPDQRLRAIRAGLAMTAALPGLNEKWQPILGEPMNLGIGINTGPAQVGNTGSSFKFKYGPLGNTVNLASRVQGLTKYLRCRLLVTAATRQGLASEFLCRRVVRTRVVNITEPVELYEVETASTPERQSFFRESETALTELEAEQFAEAAGRAGALLMSHRGDGPLLLTLSRATAELVQAGTFASVWVPPGK